MMEQEDKELQRLKLKIKKYLELENVSVLVGAGGSFHLGAPIIRTIPEDLKTQLQFSINKYFGSSPEYNKISYEDLFNCLQAEYFLNDKKGADNSLVQADIITMQKWLYSHCNTNSVGLHNAYKEDTKLQHNKYHYHEVLIKKLLQRPNNLRRVNLFTTNYDMALDYALDNLGVHYINGFMGVHNRCFRPEVYDYDIYYPGQSVSGKVHRAEKVLRYFKIHGSLSWIETESTTTNTYGIKEITVSEFDEKHRIMIYPCSTKKTFSLDLPYSELFRHFAQAITQPQSVLFCIGYSFNDEHINDIIYQALSIPSFTLIIANYSSEEDSLSNISKLKSLGDSRIIILPQNKSELSTFVGFVENVLPDLYEEEEMELVAKTMNTIYSSTEENADGTK
ncbi:MAG: SIR2 family protein [Paludibacteraceae bacterium]|nr:SIR2 family protein [Paludibacteraceae bacterium]